MAEKEQKVASSKAQKSKNEKPPAKKEEPKKEELKVEAKKSKEPEKPGPVTKTNGSGNGTSESSENGGAESAARLPAERKAPPSEEDLERYRGYVGQVWKGKCRWFNVSKGFGFIDPHFEEAKQHNDDVFVHQSALVMEGFRSLDEDEEVEFTVSLGKNGLEASGVNGVDGAKLRGHHVRPLGKKREKMIRCYKCGQLGFHQASRCKKEIPAKACYHCHSSDHMIGNCPEFQAQKQSQSESKQKRAPRKVS